MTGHCEYYEIKRRGSMRSLEALHEAKNLCCQGDGNLLLYDSFICSSIAFLIITVTSFEGLGLEFRVCLGFFFAVKSTTWQIESIFLSRINYNTRRLSQCFCNSGFNNSIFKTNRPQNFPPCYFY